MYLKSKNFLLIIVLLAIASTSNCPNQCKCDSPSISCKICLIEKFSRGYDSGQCPCLLTHQENYPPSDFCCSKNCTTCSKWGCVKCRANWTLSWDPVSLKFDCLCKENFYYEQTVQDCICKSNLQKQGHLYYQPSRFECNICPEKCKCDKYGCKFCDPSLNRNIGFSSHNISTCYCAIFIEVQKLCVPASTPTVCQTNMVNKNGTCECNQPYYMNGNSCVCKSNQDDSAYYEYLGNCYPCPEGCICNQFGCVSCQLSANRTISYNNCTCISKTFELFSQCLTLSPYNYKDLTCNSNYNPNLFYSDNTIGICRQCPVGCSCDNTGCSKCNLDSNRDLSCNCKVPFIEIDKLCIGCPQNFLYINNSCICPNKYSILLKNSFYHDEDLKYCNICPTNCSCDQTGCYSCKTSTFRNITTNAVNIKVCYCNASLNFYEDQKKICSCIPPFVFDVTSGNCQCQAPFQLNQTNQCLCSSFFALTNSKYYLYDKNDCRPCPLECICNASGCVSCSSNTGRMILISKQNLMVCPCFPITSSKSTGYCKTCPQNQYIWKNTCIKCNSKCKTCNQKECLSCNAPTFLLNGKCVCTNEDSTNNIYNQNGICICKTGYYNNTLTSCLPCPLNCQNCKYNNLTENHVVCIECNPTLFRKNDPSRDCPCIDNYYEGMNISAYCCHFSCMSCSVSGCLSCLPYTNRYLNNTNPNNVTCSCNAGFIEQFTLSCVCPPQTYFYSGQCLLCPQYCLQCNIYLQLLNCSRCAPNYNRILTRLPNNNLFYYDCSCIKGYISQLSNSICHSEYCINFTNGTCSDCMNNRILQENACVCNIGYYEDNQKNCKLCSQGCLLCTLQTLCTQCDSSNGYYLIFNLQLFQSSCSKPKTDGYIFVQNTKNMILTTILNGSLPISVQDIAVYLILSNMTDKSNTFHLNITSHQIVGNVLSIILQPFLQDYLGVSLIQVGYILQQSNKKYHVDNYFLITNQIYLPTTLTFQISFDIVIKAFVILIIIISLIFTLLGNKQNELMHHCQTLGFLAMNVRDIQMQVVPTLVYFRISMFTFLGIDSNSPFVSLVSNWNYYIEKSQGNYKYFVNDSNLIRNCGLILYFAMQNAFFIILFRFIYFKIYKTPSEEYPRLKNLIQKHKRAIFRIIDWFYKIAMYPLLFFSLNTLIKLNTNTSLLYQNFQYFNLIASAIIISLYTLITIIQFIFNQTTQFSRYFMLIEFISDVLMSIVIIMTVYSPAVMTLIPLILVRGLLQLLNQYIWIRNFTPKFYRKLGFTLIECFSVISIYYTNKAATIFLILLYFIGFIGFEIYVYWKIYKENAFEKRDYNSGRNRGMMKVKESIQEIETQKAGTLSDIHNIIL